MAQPQRCDRLLHRTELSSRVIVHVRACVRAYRQPAYRKVYRLYPIKSSCFLYFFQFFYIPIICCLLYNHHRCTESALNRAWRTMHSYMPHAQSQMSRLARTCAEWLKNNTIIDIQRFPTFWKRSSRKHKGNNNHGWHWCSSSGALQPQPALPDTNAFPTYLLRVTGCFSHFLIYFLSIGYLFYLSHRRWDIDLSDGIQAMCAAR